ncbi:glycosyltransferase [Bacteriovorax sp. PP10]|uniref:Glycosyltransferase n=1 Tax=Bacteriovorax antarcticus TaxID=3088717 RepID=A0ABU5VRF0_9BACT|nr:glycosyltransferase [Bacteriovorax sp. PP10]MEA9354983.1 glycosyltransferase [Bacteriovorax sp. PP10]
MKILAGHVILSISFIIPAYNAEKNLRECLKAITALVSLDDEIILVNDASSDSTQKIASQHNCKIINLQKNGGAAHARNHGAKISSKDILVFIDSDVLISKENIENVRSYFQNNENIQTITANVDLENLQLGFFTDFKNLYMNYIISAGSLSVNYVYGSFCATRSKNYTPWPEEIRLTEDSLWGYQQKKSGFTIHSLSELKVKHLKEYSLKSLIRNDFLISSFFARAFLGFNRWNTLYSKESFGHTSKLQKISVILSMIVLMISPIAPFLSLGIFILWFVINIRFFQFLFLQRGVSFSLKSIAWYFFTSINYFIGICHGFCIYFMEKTNLTEEREIA